MLNKTVVASFLPFEANFEILCRRLGYRFGDPLLCKQALTHRSYHPKQSYERLEFLGDALLGAIIAEYLYHTHTQLDEGRLTRLRASLVREESLAKIAHSLELSDHIVLGVGERKSGGRHRASILADVVEALIAGIYLDSGSFDTTRACVLVWYKELLASTPVDTVQKDAKSRLQEWLQAKRLPLPVYTLTDTQGTSPNETFFVECRVAIDGIAPISETGNSRRIAEQKCAERMINQLNLSFS